MISANVNCIIRLRVNSDGEGVRSVIFMQECPLSCVWCCNPETRFEKNFKTLTEAELYSYIEKDVPYFVESNGGITFSGGEPLLNSEFIASFCRNYCVDFSVNIETSLFTSKKSIDSLIPVIDNWFIDFKVFDDEKHIKYTGVSNSIIKENIEYLSKRIPKNKIVITVPLIPGFNTDDENINKTVDFLKNLNLKQIQLHPYRKSNERKHQKLGLTHLELNEVSNDFIRNISSIFFENGIENYQLKPIIEKEKCEYLKAIRRNLIDRDNLPIKIPKCDFSGKCKGTCPQCEYELKKINEFYNNRER